MAEDRESLRQKVIPIYAIEVYINEGFELLQDRIPGDKVVVRLPDKFKGGSRSE